MLFLVILRASLPGSLAQCYFYTPNTPSWLTDKIAQCKIAPIKCRRQKSADKMALTKTH
jgi:hypothetical protein